MAPFLTTNLQGVNKVRLVIFNTAGWDVLIDWEFEPSANSLYAPGSSSVKMNREVSLARHDDYPTIPGGYMIASTWYNCIVGSLDSQGDTLGLGTWDTNRGMSSYTANGNIANAVNVPSKNDYFREVVAIDY